MADSGASVGSRVGGLVPVLRPSLVCCQYFNVTTAFVSIKRGRLSSVLVMAVEKAGSLSRYPLRSRGQALYLRSIVIGRGRLDHRISISLTPHLQIFTGEIMFRMYKILTVWLSQRTLNGRYRRFPPRPIIICGPEFVFDFFCNALAGWEPTLWCPFPRFYLLRGV